MLSVACRLARAAQRRFVSNEARSNQPHESRACFNRAVSNKVPPDISPSQFASTSHFLHQCRTDHTNSSRCITLCWRIAPPSTASPIFPGGDGTPLNHTEVFQGKGKVSLRADTKHSRGSDAAKRLDLIPCAVKVSEGGILPREIVNG